MKKLALSLLTEIVLFAVLICGCTDESLYQGQFYTLQQAYDAGWITQEDLKSIAFYHNGGREGNEEIMGEDYQPQPITPEILDRVTELSIKQTFWAEYIKNDPHNSSLNDISVSYYWTCDNCVAVKIWCNGWGYNDEYREESVGGVLFIYTCGNEIKIWEAIFSGIDKALAKQIKADYTKNSEYDSSELMLSVYGEYTGTYVMFIDGPWYYMDVITTETVGGIEFVYPSSRTLIVYKGGKFYSLEQAYENEFLTHNDLLDINVKYQTKQFKIY